MEKVSLVITVFNDSKGIKKTLQALRLGNLPYEIVIVDAYSSDKTWSILEETKNVVSPGKIKIFRKKGNRSVGRNYAIKKSKGDIIAVTDAGCIPKKDWLKKLLQPFKSKSIDVVAGYYKPVVKNTFQKCLATYTCVMPDKLTDNFLPSSRSIAFKKSAWKRVGGYPEGLDTCEDLVFARRLKRCGFRFYIQKNAIVYWPQRENIWQAFKQFFAYAKGDGEAIYIRLQTPLLFGRYVLVATLFISYFITSNIQILYFLVVFSLLYIIWSILKNYKYVKKIEAILFLPILQLTSDIAVLSGFLAGLIKRYGI